MPSCSDLLPFNHSVTLVSMNNTDDKPKVGRDWIAFVVAWIPYSLLTYRFWYNVDDAFISFRYAKNWAMGYGPRYNLGPQQPEEGYVSVRPSHVRTTRKILDERVVYGVAGPGCQRSGRSSRMRFCGHPSASLRSTSVRYGRGGTSY